MGYISHLILLKIIIKPPCEPLHIKFADEASLKLINDELLRLSFFGDDNTTSLDFRNLMNLFATIRSLTLASFIDLLTIQAA